MVIQPLHLGIGRGTPVQASLPLARNLMRSAMKGLLVPTCGQTLPLISSQDAMRNCPVYTVEYDADNCVDVMIYMPTAELSED